MKSNFGILPPLEDAENAGKRERAARYAERAARALDQFIAKQ
jgi:folate-dependent tRNA-U54 methylase TrmFO/GidA